MIALAMMITLTTSAFAGNEKVKPEILEAFKNQFASAQEITWLVGSNYYKAAFTCNGAWMFAFYNTEAEFLGTVRHISSTQLPFYLQSNLKKNYARYWITDLFELSNEEGTRYYITLQDADQKIVLRSGYGSGWEVYYKES